MAAAANTNISEVVRSLTLQGGQGSQTDQVAEAIGDTLSAIVERIEQIESSQAAPVDLSPIREILGSVMVAQQTQERTLLALVNAVEKLQNAAGFSSQSARPQPAPYEHKPANNGIPEGLQPAPPGGFVGWVIKQPMKPGEQPVDRARRCLPIYNSTFYPPHPVP